MGANEKDAKLRALKIAKDSFKQYYVTLTEGVKKLFHTPEPDGLPDVSTLIQLCEQLTRKYNESLTTLSAADPIHNQVKEVIAPLKESLKLLVDNLKLRIEYLQKIGLAEDGLVKLNSDLQFMSDDKKKEQAPRVKEATNQFIKECRDLVLLVNEVHGRLVGIIAKIKDIYPNERLSDDSYVVHNILSLQGINKRMIDKLNKLSEKYAEEYSGLGDLLGAPRNEFQTNMAELDATFQSAMAPSTTPSARLSSSVLFQPSSAKSNGVPLPLPAWDRKKPSPGGQG